MMHKLYDDSLEWLDFIKRKNLNFSMENFTDGFIDDYVINPNLDWKKINEYFKKNNFAIVDNYLKEEYALRLRNFILTTNIREDYYLDYAAINFYRSGKIFPVLNNIVEESKASLEVLKDKTFLRGWAFIYENESKGVNVHADSASINLNFWVTPDECMNLKSNYNGLDIWPICPPKYWEHRDYNGNSSLTKDFIDKNKTEKISIDYKFNRLVIFNSLYFHKSHNISTKPGYENRRINYTLLYIED